MQHLSDKEELSLSMLSPDNKRFILEQAARKNITTSDYIVQVMDKYPSMFYVIKEEHDA